MIFTNFVYSLEDHGNPNSLEDSENYIPQYINIVYDGGFLKPKKNKNNQLKQPKKSKNSKNKTNKTKKSKEKLKIAIIGAGPAGISVATRINEAFNEEAEVTIFESRSEIGGQARTSNSTGILLDDGARYLLERNKVSTSYDEILYLFQQNNIDTFALPGPHYLKYSKTNDRLDPVTTSPFDSVFFLQFYAVCVAAAKYQRENPNYSFLTDNSLPFNFGNSVGMVAFINSFLDGQLYGLSTQVSGHSTLIWFAANQFFGSSSTIKMVTGGMQQAWQKVAENSGAKVLLNSPVLAVQQGIISKDHPEIVLSSGKILQFDAVVITSPLDEIESPLCLNKKNSSKFEDTYVSTVHYLSNIAPSDNLRRRYHIIDYLGDVDCPVSTIQYAAFSSTLDSHVWSASMYEQKKNTNEESSLTQAKPWIEKMMLAIDSEYDTRKTSFVKNSWQLFRYNIRFSEENFASKLPQKINSLQGVSNIWYGGGVLSHWDIASVLHQSSMIVEKMSNAYALQKWKYVPAAQKNTNEKIINALEGAAVNPTIDDLVGTYRLEGHLFANEIKLEMVTNEDNIMSTLPIHAVAKMMEAPIVAVGKIITKNTNFIGDLKSIPGFSLLDQEVDGYYVALHANGVVRFHSISQSPNIKQVLNFFDSKGSQDSQLNIGHAIKYGCFCFGVMKKSSFGGITIQRYNRWGEDVDKYYLMTKLKERKSL